MTAPSIYILVLLLAIEAGILIVAQKPVGKKIFKYLPSMFWIYFLPMLATTLGALPEKSPIYDLIGTWVLPAALVLLLMSADIRGILRLGPTALAVMAASVFGIMAGAVTVFVLFHSSLPDQAWKGIGSLSASWIGGSANMVAVGKAVAIPDRLLASIVVVDTIIPYCWMGLLIALSVHQQKFDRWNHSNTRMIDDLAGRTKTYLPTGKTTVSIGGIMIIAIVAISGAFAAVVASRYLPASKNIISASAWAIILATLLGIVLSFTPVRQLESYGSNTIGYALLYLVLASIGAKTSLRQIDSVPVLLAAGATWIAIHAAILIIAARLLRAPMALLATASQASIGGPASAPVVAGVYHPELAAVGLLLAVLGNIAGTFLGLITAQLCRLIST
jgi:uncharacterized membrane protein